MNTRAASFARVRLHDYLELAKLRLVSLVLLSSAVGFFLASEGPLDWGLLILSFTGTALVAGGSMGFNQWMERVEDAKMTRTAKRPLPGGRMQPREAFIFSFLLSAAGLVLLYFSVNPVAAFLSGLTLVSYILLYTPLKKITSLCTVLGAIPGALPPMIGWSSVTGRVSYEAWVLFAIIFLWQMPHFLAIAWLCRKEYAAAGFQMLSVTDPSGAQAARQIILYTSALLPVSLLPTLIGLTGGIYFTGTLIAGAYFIYLGFLGLKNLDQYARPLFRASILYLALILILMVVDKA